MTTDHLVARDGRSDEALLLLVLDGGADGDAAWTELVDRITPRLYAIARSFRLDPATCEDLIQTAWLRLVERSAQLREPGAIRPWLCTVVRNEARKVVTRTRTVPVGEGWERTPDLGGELDSGLLAEERAVAMRAAFAQLSDECQQLLRLSVAQPGLSYDELAAAVGRPRGSLGPTRRRCLDRLRQHLPPGMEP